MAGTSHVLALFPGLSTELCLIAGVALYKCGV